MTIFAPDECIAAAATADDGLTSVIRVSGADCLIQVQKAALPIPDTTWSFIETIWICGQAHIPCRVFLARGPRSFTGFDMLEITVPASRIIVDACLQQLAVHNIAAASPGAFTRQALSNRRLQLDQAEGILAMTQAADADAAANALHRLRGILSQDIEPLREEVIMLRAQVEAGLDFLEEEDVRAYDPDKLMAVLDDVAAMVQRWTRAANSVGTELMVCLVGHSNAGKSALFHQLTGADVIISDQQGTTRDHVEAEYISAGRKVRMIDTAGYLDHCSDELDQAAIATGRDLISSAQLIIACSSPDARLREQDLSALPVERTIVCATKADVGHIDQRALLAVSSMDGSGIQQLSGLIQERLGLAASGDARQQKHLQAVAHIIDGMHKQWPGDDLLADDLFQICEHLGDIIGVTSTDDVLNYIFSRFCIGK
ncbi:MAG: 50S ribosome-binding GTPase [Planctomycetes bacterium]|nr:50S ribosome-binding GTPase [Planctomycetota bacterium]